MAEETERLAHETEPESSDSEEETAVATIVGQVSRDTRRVSWDPKVKRKIF